MKPEKEIKEKLEELDQVEEQIKKTIFWKLSDEMKGIKKTLKWVLKNENK